METSSDEAIALWKERADEETKKKKAEQEFVKWLSLMLLGHAQRRPI